MHQREKNFSSPQTLNTKFCLSSRLHQAVTDCLRIFRGIPSVPMFKFQIKFQSGFFEYCIIKAKSNIFIIFAGFKIELKFKLKSMLNMSKIFKKLWGHFRWKFWVWNLSKFEVVWRITLSKIMPILSLRFYRVHNSAQFSYKTWSTGSKVIILLLKVTKFQSTYFFFQFIEVYFSGLLTSMKQSYIFTIYKSY